MQNKEHLIHTIGDSHAFQNGCVSGEGYKVIQHHLGPVLCYSFGIEGLNRCDIRRFNIKDGDSIVFSLGEIDCRCHVHKHVSEEKGYKQVINEIVSNYLEAIKLNVKVSNISFKNVCVYNVLPPVSKTNTKEDPSFPFLGSDEQRRDYVTYFNECVSSLCKEYGYVFFDVYNHYTDDNGFLNKELSDGNVHARDKSYVRNFIIEQNI